MQHNQHKSTLQRMTLFRIQFTSYLCAERVLRWAGDGFWREGKTRCSLELRADHHGGACTAHAVGIVQQPELQGVRKCRTGSDGVSGTCLAERPLMALSANTAGELRSVRLSAMITLLPATREHQDSIEP